jgi:hypothetical protein
MIVGMCGLLVFLELGLSIPKIPAPDASNDESYVSVPRNGGAKNYVSPPVA